jgi:hypothetical protein
MGRAPPREDVGVVADPRGQESGELTLGGDPSSAPPADQPAPVEGRVGDAQEEAERGAAVLGHEGDCVGLSTNVRWYARRNESPRRVKKPCCSSLRWRAEVQPRSSLPSGRTRMATARLYPFGPMR